MENQISTQNQPVSPAIIQSLILEGDISKMNPQQKVEYVTKLCQSLGLNSLSQPFQIIKFQGKEKLYATKDCTEQLRKVHGVSVTESVSEKTDDLLIVHVKVQDKTGRTDVGTGAVVIGQIKGEALANAYMKCETKAKRRATLSICGLGMLDESELDTMPVHTTEEIGRVEISYGQRSKIESLIRSSAYDVDAQDRFFSELEESKYLDEVESLVTMLRQNQAVTEHDHLKAIKEEAK